MVVLQSEEMYKKIQQKISPSQEQQVVLLGNRLGVNIVALRHENETGAVHEQTQTE